METVHFSSSPELFVLAQESFENLTSELSPLLPAAQFEHVGSTATPGCLTKGDLDVQARVRPADFQQGREVLAARYEANPGGFSSAHSASFKDDHARPPLGIHITVVGCGDDFQWKNRELLLAHANLRSEYDALKRAFEGKSMDAYRDAKHTFFQRLSEMPEYRS